MMGELLADLRDSIREDIICCIEADGDVVQRFPELLDEVVQIVMNRFDDKISELKETDDG